MLKIIGIIAVVAIIGWIIGFVKSDGDTEDANDTAIGMGAGCATVLFHIFIAGLVTMTIIWLFGAIFG